MIPENIANLDKAARSAGLKGGVITNTSLQLRSCGCFITAFNFEGLLTENWKEKADSFTGIVDEMKLPYDLVYLNTFPGTDIINRITYRNFCPHCKKNFQLDGIIGMGSIVWIDKTGKAPSL